MSEGAHDVVQTIWVTAILAVALWLLIRDPAPDPLLHLCLWTTTYFLVYHDVWEHHYLFLLPVCIMLYQRQPSRWLLLLYGLIAVWTPYILLDPQGRSAIDASMRWTPLTPRWRDVFYHASKAVPAMGLWLHIAARIRRACRCPAMGAAC
jgi:hypothetical protein